ncbi:hypothetical protein SEA_LATRETIUM_27 [Mycobacterium phage Latretium]|nr:hypothetical protein SEA_LATRETIUM_27 [Mycobacterium phage Latretium]
MLRTATATVLATAILALGIPAVADAAPKHCDNHGTGTGLIYKHACATGNGGRGPSWTTDGDAYLGADGHTYQDYKCTARCNGGMKKHKTVKVDNAPADNDSAE